MPYDNGIDESKDVLEKVSRGTRKLTRPLRKKVGKKVKQIGSKLIKWLINLLKTLLSSISGFLPVVCAIVLIIVIIVSVIAAILSYQNSQSSLLIRLSTRSEIITAMFESYVDNTYREGWYIDYENGGRLVEANLESLSNIDYDEYGNNTSDRQKYKNILNYIKNNGYEYELCALWDVLVKDTVSPLIYNMYKDLYHGDISDDRRFKDKESTYEGICEFYYYAKDDAYSDEEMNANGANGGAVIKDTDGTGKYFKIGFFSRYEQEQMYSQPIHQYYTTQMMKACMDAFVDESGHYVIDRNELLQMSDEHSEDNTESSGNTTTTEISTFYVDCSENLTELIYDNFKRGLDNHFANICYVNGDSQNGELQKSSLWTYVSGQILQQIPGFDSSNYAPDNNSYEQIIKDSLLDKIKISARTFLVSAASGNASGIVALAHQQLGNGGQRYCDELYNGVLVDWCAIYAGWLLQEGGGITLSDYGWSAGVMSWQRGLASKGLWHESSSTYKPKIGDIVIMNNYGHVGIVIDVNDTEFTTSEGNTSPSDGPGEWCTRSVVSEYTYSFDDSYINGYGEVTISSIGLGGEFNLSPTTVDSNYKAISFRTWKGRALTRAERDVLEKTVVGEFGTDYTGACLIAQCMRDALVYGQCDNVLDLPDVMQYDGYDPNNVANDISKNAVKYVFDEGGIVVQHRILVMYNPSLCTSAWHESLHFIVQQGEVRFFDYWD